MPSSDGQSEWPPFRRPFSLEGATLMRPLPEEPDPWDDQPQHALDPDQIPFDADEDEESEPEPGDFYFDDDFRDDT